MDKILRLESLYKKRYRGWNIRHFYGHYCDEHGSPRSYSRVKNRL